MIVIFEQKETVLPKKEGLSDINDLKTLGIPVNHDVDKEINSYFSKKESSDTLEQKNGLEINPSDDEMRLCQIKAFGFKDGVLQHNMPCPICLKRPAVYVNDGAISFFAPCMTCQDNGFYTSNKNKKGRWFG